MKWKQSVHSTTLLYSHTFYSLLLPFFVLEAIKFSSMTSFFIRHSASMSKFKECEKSRGINFLLKNHTKKLLHQVPPPPFKFANCPSPPFWTIPPNILIFHETPLKNWIFQWTPIIKFFTLNPKPLKVTKFLVKT